MFVWRLNDSYLYLLSQTQIVFCKCKGDSRATQNFYALRYLKSELLKYTLKIQISTSRSKMKHPETILPCPNQLCMLNSSLLAFTCIKNMNVEIIKLPSDMGTEGIIVNGFSFTKKLCKYHSVAQQLQPVAQPVSIINCMSFHRFWNHRFPILQCPD